MNGAYRSRALRRVRRLLAALRRSSSAPEGSSARTETALSGPSWMHRRTILPRLAMEEKTWNHGRRDSIVQPRRRWARDERPQAVAAPKRLNANSNTGGGR